MKQPLTFALLLAALLCAGCDKKAQATGQNVATTLNDLAERDPVRYVTVLGLRTKTTHNDGGAVYVGRGVGVPMGGSTTTDYVLRTLNEDVEIGRDNYVLLARFLQQQAEAGRAKLFPQGDGFDIVRPQEGVTVCMGGNLLSSGGLRPCPEVVRRRVVSLTLQAGGDSAGRLNTTDGTYRVTHKQGKQLVDLLTEAGRVREQAGTFTVTGGQKLDVCLAPYPGRRGVFYVPPVSCEAAMRASGQAQRENP